MSSPYPDEQRHLDRAYNTLDAKVTASQKMLGGAAGIRTSHAQSRLESEAMQQQFINRLDALEAAERRLCFGRLDRVEGDHLYIGRVGLTDEDKQIIQIDWRAPAAAPYYQASPHDPQGLTRRRHISTEHRTVVGVHDDVFDYDAFAESDLAGDSVLLAALNKERTGKMGDIVETIQAEQDKIIRSDSSGILVVEGGPGTGKTVVALHRSAHLLYRDRAILERKGVLIIGPSSRFLTYIDNVLPALGETGVVLATIPDLYPGAVITVLDPDPVAALKGDLRFTTLLSNAVNQLRRRPVKGVTLQFNKEIVHLELNAIDSAARRALSLEPQYNLARPIFLTSLMKKIVNQLAQKREIDLDDEYERDELMQEVRESLQARRELNLLWMPRSPEQVLRFLFTNPNYLFSAASGTFTDKELKLLHRDSYGSSVYDIPLLDELAELLGPLDDESEQAVHDSERDLAQAAAYGTGVDAEQLLSRYKAADSSGTVAERALADREWVYGHAVIDEAQELSPMAWRMLSRRVPSRSMTVVGDIHQASTPGAAGSWAAALDPFALGRWRNVTLTVNYRTPATTIALAEQIMAAHGIAITSHAARVGDYKPLIKHALDIVKEVSNHIEHTGLTALIAPAPLRSVLAATYPSLPVISPDQAKGLEFDNIILLEPTSLLEESTLASLYVAITRATQRLIVLHSRELPKGF